jgi:hypothetical protein
MSIMFDARAVAPTPPIDLDTLPPTHLLISQCTETDCVGCPAYSQGCVRLTWYLLDAEVVVHAECIVKEPLCRAFYYPHDPRSIRFDPAFTDDVRESLFATLRQLTPEYSFIGPPDPLPNLPPLSDTVVPDDSMEDPRSVCSICLEIMDWEQDLTFLECSHIFHMSCLYDWIDSGKQGANKICPYCREPIL